MNVEVVIPTYNRLWAIKKVVPSYLLLPEVNRVIVVDDGSTDGTYEWLNSQYGNHQKMILIRHSKRLGACKSRNDGASKAKSLYVFFADDDMLLGPQNAFSILINDLTKGNAEIIAPVLIFPEGTEPGFSISPKKQPTDLLFMCHRILLERKPIKTLLRILPNDSFPSAQLPGLMLMRRSVLEKVQYDELLGENSYRDETDFQLKAIDLGFRLLACPKVYLYDLLRVNDTGGCHSSNLLKYEVLCCRNNWRVLKRHQRVIRRIGVRAPIQIMQILFIATHFLNIFPRRVIYELRKKVGLAY